MRFKLIWLDRELTTGTLVDIAWYMAAVWDSRPQAVTMGKLMNLGYTLRQI